MSSLTTRALTDFNVKENDVITVGKRRYKTETFLGAGSYGIVAKCTNLDTSQNVALKMVQKDSAWTGFQELAILQKIRQLNKKCNIVELLDQFKHNEHICLVFEMLDMSLLDFMIQRNSEPLGLPEIRVIGQQMLVALEALKSFGVVHADIKQDNVMLVNHTLQPFKLKLIDFGLAGAVSDFPQGSTIQALGYRAPEVMLGLKIDEGIDMWALGCVLVSLYLGDHLYPLKCEYEVMRFIVKMHGTPEDHLLSSGMATDTFFTKLNENQWRLKTREEYRPKLRSGAKRHLSNFDQLDSLDDLVKFNTEIQDAAELEDKKAFISLMKCMLCVDPSGRITPTQALGHHFITMKCFDERPFMSDHESESHLAVEKVQLTLPSVATESYKTSSEVIYNTLSPESSDDLPAVKSDVNPTEELKSGCKTKTADEKQQSLTTDNSEAAGETVSPDRENEQEDCAGDLTVTCSENKVANGETDNKSISNEGFVEVKCTRKWVKRVGNFFARVFRRFK